MSLLLQNENEIAASKPLSLAKLKSLKHTFTIKFGREPEFYSRAPGRVNLIGEHIDYMGFGILPFAVQKECMIAVAKNQTGLIRVGHVNPKYEEGDFNIEEFDKSEFDTYLKFVRAGYLAAKQNKKGGINGLDLLVSGNVPIAAGLSSSSSLVVCSALAFIYDNGFEGVDTFKFLECIIKEELATGMAGGGMDQTISLLGKEDSALFINFNPLRVEPVNLPNSVTFVVSNSLVPSPKHETLPFRYNKRVCECSIGCAILCKSLGIPLLVKVKDLLEAAKLTVEEALKLLNERIHPNFYSKEEIISLFGEESLANIFKNLLPQFWQDVWEQNEEFFPFQRLLHVLEETQRVEKFVAECKSENPSIEVLATLMNQSHDSCLSLYDCSAEKLDELVVLSRNSGALGSRLTGAGWGGCAISMVPKDKVTEFMDCLEKEFYQLAFSEEVCFQTTPQPGASIILPQ